MVVGKSFISVGLTENERQLLRSCITRNGALLKGGCCREFCLLVQGEGIFLHIYLY